MDRYRDRNLLVRFRAAGVAAGALVLLVGGVVGANAAGSSQPVECSSDGTTLSCPLPAPVTVTETATETAPGSTVTVLGPTTTATATVTVTQSPAPTSSVAPTTVSQPPVTSSAAPTTSAAPTSAAQPAAFPDATNTGAPAGVTLHACNGIIQTAGTYDACLFTGQVSIRANNVTISRSQINGQLDLTYSKTGVVVSDTTVNCGCQSTSDTSTPTAVYGGSNFTLLRDNIYNGGHGVAVESNVTIQDSYIHGLGGNNQAHKDAIYSGNGDNVTIKHNSIECYDGPAQGCTSAVGLLSDFANQTHWTITNNLLNGGVSCFYAWGGPGKRYHSSYITFTNNHFGRKFFTSCGYYGPVSYWDASQPGMVWSGNVWDDTGAPVPPAN